MTNWSMMMSPSTESSETFEGRVMALRAQMQGGTQYAPTAVVRRLMMPMLLPQALALPDPECYHRVVVCAAAGNGAFELTRWLSETYDLPKASRRHAGETALDSGSDYVDFMHGGYPCRVIAVARSSLNQGLHRSLVPDWRFLVLLFSGEPKRDIALLELVRETFQDAAAVPEVLAIAPDAQSHHHISRVARAQGLNCLNAGVMSDTESEAIWQAVDQRLAQADAPHNSVWAVLSGFQAL